MSLTKATFSMIDHAPINVVDFGADPTGVTDSTNAITLAFAKALSLIQQYNATFQQNLGSQPTVYFPYGKYKLTASVGNGVGHVIVKGENSILFSTDNTINLLNLGTYNVIVEKLSFDGGAKHIRLGGPRIEGGNITIRDCNFNIAKTRCITLDRSDISGFSGYPAIMRIHDCKSYGSGFLEAYVNGLTVSDCWLAWDTSGAVWDGGPLFIANDHINCYNLLEIPYNNNTNCYPRFQSVTGFASEDTLAVTAIGCRFGGETSATPIADFIQPGCVLIMNGCGLFGCANTYWIKCHGAPRTIAVSNCLGDMGDGVWGMWFDAATITSINDILSNSTINLSLNTAFTPPYIPIYSSNSLVNNGFTFRFIPQQNTQAAKEAADVVLSNYLPGDGFTYTSSPYVTTYSGIGFTGTKNILGYNFQYFTSSSDGWLLYIGASGFVAPLVGTYTFSCWIDVPIPCSATFKTTTSGANSIFTNTQMLDAGLNFFTARFYHDGTTSTTPTITINGSLANVQVSVGAMSIHQGLIAGRFQTPGATTSSLSKHFYGSAVPSSNKWYVGDIVWNTAPTSGGPPGWMCTAAGSPGTWKAMANLA